MCSGCVKLQGDEENIRKQYKITHHIYEMAVHLLSGSKTLDY